MGSTSEERNRDTKQMKLTNLLIFLSVISIGVSSTRNEARDCVTSCGSFETLGNHCYYWEYWEYNWNDAVRKCSRRGAHLASVTSDAINQYVLRGMKSRGLPFIWIGGTDKDEEGRWQWMDGSPFGFTYWGPGEPNSAGGKEEDCLVHGSGSENMWNDFPCLWKAHGFLCAKKICSTG